MVNKKYLDQALRIRKDFLKTDNKLFNLKGDLELVYRNINTTLQELIEIRDSSDEYSTSEDFQTDVLKKLAEFEDESKRAESVLKPLNDEMESLKSEEQELYKTLVSEYPNVPEDELIKEVQSYVKSKLT